MILGDNNMEGIIIDELKLYRGEDFFVKDGIIIHQPTLNEICDYGEREYWSIIHTLTSVGADMKFQLYDIGIDYTKISDYELFYMLCKGITKEQTSILFGDLDFSKFQLFKKKDADEVVMYDSESEIYIDEYTYFVIVNILRKIHGLKRNDQLPGNESTKQILIDDARDEYIMNKNKEYHSQLKNMISAMINCAGFQYNHSNVWEMKINAFIDSVKRMSKIKNADLLLQSGYSGFGIDLKKISDKQLDWLGELE